MRTTLSSKVVLRVAGLLLLLSAGVAQLTFVQMRRAAIEEQAKVLDVLNYTFEILLSQDAVPSLQRVIENSATIAGVRRIVIIDRERRALASSARTDVGRAVDAPEVIDFFSSGRFERVKVERDREIVFLQPLRGSHFMGGAAGDIAGVALVSIAVEEIEDEARASALRLLAVSLGSYLVIFLVLVFALRALVTGPVQKLAVIAQRFRAGDRSLRSLLRRGDEIGTLSSAFDAMADEVDALLKGLEEQVAARTADLEEKRAALERALEDLKASTAARLALAETVRELSTPVMKLYDQILVMPLVGHIDDDRAQQIQRSLLEGIAASRATEVILDLTGVPVVDTRVAEGLLQAAGAARMLGASVTLVGIKPGVAQSIVGLGIDLSKISTRANLQRGLVSALRRLGLFVGVGVGVGVGGGRGRAGAGRPGRGSGAAA